MPVAVKLGPHFSSTGEMARRLDEAGRTGSCSSTASCSPTSTRRPSRSCRPIGLSSAAEGRLPRTWIALLYGRLRAVARRDDRGSRAPADVAKYLLAGADVVMTASALLRHGPEHARVLLDGLSDWMPPEGVRLARRAARDALVPPTGDETAHERAGDVSALREANTGTYGPW